MVHVLEQLRRRFKIAQLQGLEPAGTLAVVVDRKRHRVVITNAILFWCLMPVMSVGARVKFRAAVTIRLTAGVAAASLLPQVAIINAILSKPWINAACV